VSVTTPRDYTRIMRLALLATIMAVAAGCQSKQYDAGRLALVTGSRLSGATIPYDWDGDRLLAVGDPALQYLYDAAGNLRLIHQGDDVIELVDYSCWQ